MVVGLPLLWKKVVGLYLERSKKMIHFFQIFLKHFYSLINALIYLYEDAKSNNTKRERVYIFLGSWKHISRIELTNDITWRSCQCQPMWNQGQQLVAKGSPRVFRGWLLRRGICCTGLNTREKSERIRSGTIRPGEPLTVILHECLSFSVWDAVCVSSRSPGSISLSSFYFHSLSLFLSPYSTSRVFLLLSILLPDGVSMREMYMCTRSINALYISGRYITTRPRNRDANFILGIVN